MNSCINASPSASKRGRCNAMLVLLGLLNLILALPLQAAKPTVPLAPSNVAAAAASSSQINLSWRDNSANESGFIIQRSASSSGPWGQIATAGANVTSYANAGLSAGATYYYRVCAYNSRGSSAYSTPASAATSGGCTYALSSSSASAAATGGNGSVNVTAGIGCSWAASSSAAWLTITAGGSGNGSGTVSYSVAANTSTSGRSGTISVQGQAFTVNQAGAACNYSLSASSTSAAAAGGNGSVNVTAGIGCSWSANSSAAWLTITAGGSGNGSGTVSYSVAANTSTSGRSGTISVMGQNFTVNQAGAACTYSLSASSTSAAAAGGNGSVNVTAGIGCSWSASSSAAWLTITAGGNGNGSGTVSYSVAANTSTSGRSGTISVMGQNFTVNQAGAACSYSLSASSTSAAATGGNGSVNVTAGIGCSWSASSSAAWLTITAGGSGNGSGTVSYSVAANTTTSGRSATISVQGQIFTVNQAGVVCTYALSASSTSVGAGSTSGNVGVTAGASCVWVAAVDSSGAGWISITSGSAGTGNGTVYYTVTANTSASTRSGTMTIAGRPFTVSQAGAAGDGTAPTVSLTSPATGTVSGGVAISANASDNVGVARVEFFVDGALVGTDAAAAYSASWDTATSANGNHTLSAKAYDAAGNVGTSANLVVTVSNTTISGGAWAKRFGGSLVDGGSGVAVDASGNVFLAGTFKSVADFGGTPLVSAGGSDLVLAKYNSDGVHQWSYRFGASGDETVRGIAVDASGNIFVAGYFGGSANFGGTTLTSAGQSDAFVAKYNASGQHQWSKGFGSTGSTTYINGFNGLAVDSQGNVVVTGTFKGDADFGSGVLHSLWGTAVNIVVAKYSTTGGNLWAKTFACGNENYANAVAVDRSDNVLLTGSFFTSINFASNDGLDRTITTAYPTYQNIFAAKLNANGAHVWSKRYGSVKGDKGMSIAADGNGDVIVFGMFYKQTDLGNGTIYGGALDNDAFVAKYSSTDGTYRWAVPMVGNNGCWANAVKTDTQNNVVLTGYYYGTFNFGGQSLTSTLNSYDGFAAKYNSAGVPVWVDNFGGNSSDGGTALAIDRTDHPVITGAFGGTMTLGGSSLVSAGSQDVLLWRRAP